MLLRHGATRVTRTAPAARASTSATAARFTRASSTAGPSTPRAAPQPERSVLEIAGPDAPKFLNGLLCKNVESLKGGYTGVLNASGRVLHPAFVIPIDPKTNRYLVSHVPGADHPAPLEKYLKPFRLRSKVRIRDATSEWDVWSAWGGAGADTNAPSVTWRYGNAGAAERLWTWSGEPAPLGLSEKEHGCWDLRAGWGAAGLGRHVIVPKGEKLSLLSNYDTATTEEYNLRRMVLGVPEGPAEVVPGVALPLESDMDIHGGVDVRKGCYVGQELTVRTYHTGATRKRILPVRLFPLSGSAPLASVAEGSASGPSRGGQQGIDITFTPSSDSKSKKPRSAGKLLALHADSTSVGLALIRLEFADRAWWADGASDGTVADWVSGAKGTLTAEVGGTRWGVWVGKGEAYAEALANLPPPREEVEEEE
ncbi:hypothetical protein VHUM_03874 [Vanrija humicola]|uniref:Aminomethyltransferase folate-binding domain-containing protein n=1 Tax=Vanrija humicola TaxID=5417 RepID=A0A7D8UWD1_VANHU|nr:hypothetical protein VHUM_03874 [Vanrija humicola]